MLVLVMHLVKWVHFHLLFRLCLLIEFQAFECFLAEIRPSHEYSSEGKWSADASACFSRLTSNKPLIAQVVLLASM